MIDYSIRPQFCTCHNSSSVVTCANLWPDRIIVIWKRIFTKLWAHKSLGSCIIQQEMVRWNMLCMAMKKYWYPWKNKPTGFVIIIGFLCQILPVVFLICMWHGVPGRVDLWHWSRARVRRDHYGHRITAQRWTGLVDRRDTLGAPITNMD